MKRFVKNNLKIFIIIVLLCSSGIVYAAYSYVAGTVSFSPQNEEWETDNVADALYDLYDRVDNMNNSSVASKVTWNYDYTGNMREFTAPETGNYRIELWGAEANIGTYGVNPGKGAYTSGIIRLNKKDKLKIYVGGRNGWNGGGTGEQTGGGATDVRTAASNLYSRIMVAAGGGGAFYSKCGTVSSVGDAGGLVGYNAGGNFGNCTQGAGSGHSTDFSGQGATQYSGGKAGAAGYDAFESQMDGAFGVGGYKTSRSSGGGAGWYGGGHGRHPGSTHSGGGGGSSYISGHEGCLAVKGDNTTELKEGCTTTSISKECSVSYTGLSFTDTKMVDGRGYNWTTQIGSHDKQLQPDGSYTDGHSGNGYARITLIKS